MIPTRTRYWVIVFALTLAIVTYIDRVCISQAAPLISKDLNLSKVEMGYAFSAFAVGYAIYEIPGGYLGDWMGARRVLTRIVVWWSLFTAATGYAWSTMSLIVTRFLFGAGEAGCFPNVTRAFTTWLPAEERVRAQGLMWWSARWGGAFTPLLVVWVLRLMNWRRSFVLFGAAGIVWAVWFWIWFRDHPREKPSVNAAELKLVAGTETLAAASGGLPWRGLLGSLFLPLAAVGGVYLLFRGLGAAAATVLLVALAVGAGILCRRSHERPPAVALAAPAGGHSGVPWCKLYRNSTVWLLCGQYFCLSYGWYFYISWLPTYLQEARGLAVTQSAVLAGLPLFLGGLGSLFGGFFSDSLARRIGAVKTRRRMAYVGFAGATMLLLVSAHTPHPVLAMVIMGLASFSNDLAMPGSWGACMDVGGKYAGTLSGMMNMAGNLGGALSPVAIGYILRETNNNWTITFYASAAVYFAGAFLWRFIDPVTPIEQ